METGNHNPCHSAVVPTQQLSCKINSLLISNDINQCFAYAGCCSLWLFCRREHFWWILFLAFLPLERMHLVEKYLALMHLMIWATNYAHFWSDLIVDGNCTTHHHVDKILSLLLFHWFNITNQLHIRSSSISTW